MAKLTNQQKKEWAKLLYTKEHLSQKDIAERVGVTPQTVNRWVKNELWDKLKISLSVTRDEQLAQLYAQLAELNGAISNREEGNRYPNAKEADTVVKLTNSIEKLERDSGAGEIMNSFAQFTKWLRERNLEAAQQLLPLLDDFIKYKLQ